jgi:hypothetical protein
VEQQLAEEGHHVDKHLERSRARKAPELFVRAARACGPRRVSPPPFSREEPRRLLCGRLLRDLTL